MKAAGKKEVCDSKCTWGLPEPDLHVVKILQLQMLTERLVLGPAL